MTAKPCLDCGAVTTRGSRCPACAQRHEAARDARRRTTADRGYGARWQAVSKAAIAEQPWCSACGATADLTADHIVPLRAGGRSVQSNAAVLCRSCNGRKAGRTPAPTRDGRDA